MNKWLALLTVLPTLALAEDPLALYEAPTTKWTGALELNREPDLIIDLPAQEIPATGMIPYRYVTVDIPLEEDRWVQASEWLPGDRTVLHHTLNQLVGPGTKPSFGGFLGNQSGRDSDQVDLAAYVPGGTATVFPENTGGLLKAGSSLQLQLHYTTNGTAAVDHSKLGVWFYPKDEVPAERMTGMCACIFPDEWTNIPPGDPNFVQTQSITTRNDIELHTFLPHMHWRGKSMKAVAYYPDGTQEDLINVANYDYDWQLAYTWEEPKFIPAGTTITVDGAFDNSAQNRANPDPERSVPWGQMSEDEMFFGAMTWKNLK